MVALNPITVPTNIDVTQGVTLVSDITDACFQWCAEQQVVHVYNVDSASVVIVAVSFIFHSLYFLGEESDFFKKHRNTFMYASRLILLIFFVYYFFYIRWGLIP